MRVHVRSLSMAAQQFSSKMVNATDQTSTGQVARTLVTRGRAFIYLFPRMRKAPPAVVSLILLLSRDVETNSGPSCYAWGQNFRRSDTSPILRQPAELKIQTETELKIHCSVVVHSQLPVPWRSPTNGGPGPPVSSQTSSARYSWHMKCGT